MFRKIRSYIREFKLTMKMKLVLSLSSIAVILLVSSFISIMEYSRMSSYVSNLIAGNIGSINAAQKLADAANAYNLGILAVIGDNSTEHIPELRQNDFIAHCDSLKSSLTLASMLPLADSVLYSYSAYYAYYSGTSASYTVRFHQLHGSGISTGCSLIPTGCAPI